jgi:tetratricopeptide (TPR) repeat protein
MSDPDKTVFISYRRNVSSFIARSIFLDLRANGYDVFMDVESIDNGTFDTVILNQIAARAHFVIILTPGTLEDCDRPGDWLRREIEEAMTLQRNIVPVLVNEFKFESAKPLLTGKLAELPRFNGLTLPHEYFDEAMVRLRSRYLKQPVVGTIQPTPVIEQPEVAQKIEEAAAEPAPTEEQLSAEQYFQRAYARPDHDYPGKLADYTEAIRLNAEYAAAYNNRGIARKDSGDVQGAIDDYTQAIRFNPGLAEAYNNRGTARKASGQTQGIIEDYSEAIRLNPRLPEAYINRGNARQANDDLQGAIDDYTAYIEASGRQQDAVRGEIEKLRQELARLRQE